MEVCIIKGCGKEAHCRGLCESCYQAAYKLVRTGETDWDKMVDAGLARESNAVGPLRKQFAKSSAKTKPAKATKPRRK